MSKNTQKIKDALKGRSTLNLGGLERIKRDLGIRGGVIPIAESMGIRISAGARTGGNSTPVDVPGFGEFSSEGFLSPAEFDAQSLLNQLNQQGNISADVARINGKSLLEVEKIKGNTTLKASKFALEGTKYAADKELQGTQYSSDRQLESVLGAENIRARGAIDLQGIINAGAANVENIRGEYGIKGKKVDQKTAILGSLVSAFNF